MVLLILAGVSGTGKGTVGRALRARNERLHFSVSHTTRRARTGEVDGRDYHFVERGRFDEMVAAGEFAEWAEYVGKRYGTAKETIRAAAAEGIDLLFDIEVQGAEQLREAFPAETVSVFLLPPSWSTLAQRLTDRGTDDAATIARRLARGRKELDFAHRFDHLVVNDDLERAVYEVECIYRSAGTRTAGRLGLLDALRSEVGA